MKMKMLCALSIVVVSVMGLSWMPSVMAVDDICSDPMITKDQKRLAGCAKEDEDKTVLPLAVTLIETAISITGILAAGVIVYGGITYTMSTGDASKANKAKNILIYGLAGLLVSMLSWAIVHFVSLSVFG